jgi:hypothetical protein
VPLATGLHLATLARLHTRQAFLRQLVMMSRGFRAALRWLSLVTLVAIKTKYRSQVLASKTSPIQGKHIEHLNN